MKVKMFLARKVFVKMACKITMLQGLILTFFAGREDYFNQYRHLKFQICNIEEKS